MDFRELREAIEEVELVDCHAHNIVALDSTFPFIRCFSEAEGDALSYAPHSLSFKVTFSRNSRNLRHIAELYGSELSLHGVEEYRRLSGLQSISSTCFEAARISAILIDDGIESMTWEWHKRLAPVVGRILRIERLAVKILDEEFPDGGAWTLDTSTETYLGKLKSYPFSLSLISFCYLVLIDFWLKSIAAYRSGLEINTNATRKDAEEGLSEILTGKPTRIMNKSFIDYVFTSSLEVALCFDLPVQIHTGFGDKDLDMRLSNSLHLRTLLEDKRFSKYRIVLSHASYPFSKEASHLASVYLDFGLAVPKLSFHGMISSVKELLELAPIKKVIFSTDGYAFPETFYLAIQATKDIFAQNAIQFYKINLSLDSKHTVTPYSMKMNTSASHNEVSLVRIIWVDGSGQHRCREETVLADMQLKPGEAWEYCPREALRRASKILKDEFDLDVNAGFESDFFSLEECTKKEEWMPIDSAPYGSTSAFDATSPLLHEVVAALNSLNITVEQLLIFDIVFVIDKDLDMGLSSSLHLRTLLEDKRFSKCRIVLSHASYPFSKEASYLASVYPQVYLDFGLAVPKLNFHGMISSVIFSTDGYAFPETFYLGAKQAREVVFSVLRDACIDGDLSIPEAIVATKDIFAQNAIQFYKINLSFDSKHTVTPYSMKMNTSASHNDVSLVRIIWVDGSGQHRCRVVPGKRFNNVTKKNGVGLTFACMGATSFADAPPNETNLTGVGEIRLTPDLSTKKTQEEMVLADMQLKPGEAWEYCPRESLRRASKILKDEFDLEMNAGFESEFFLLKSVLREEKEEWMPIDSAPYGSTSAFDATSPLLHEVVAALNSLNITVEQAEAGKGQFEMAMGYTLLELLQGNMDYLQLSCQISYALDDIGSGSHVHISLDQNGENVFKASDETSWYGMSTVGEEFMAGVLHHLPAIMAFTAPVPNSYDRIVPNTWSGAYQCWGKENREAALRTACPPGIPDGLVSNFEIKSFDGCANPYLGFAAGIDGLRRHLSLPEPVDTNPHSLADKLHRLPASLSESLEALQKDSVLTDLFSEKLLVAIKGIRKTCLILIGWTCPTIAVSVCIIRLYMRGWCHKKSKADIYIKSTIKTKQTQLNNLQNPCPEP
ncbi:protein flug [Quercus suber]|uniref:Protein flug n=1 Tax=Quercus suber TaxID=58331 RepID=A0AAW0JW25_QUESU